MANTLGQLFGDIANAIRSKTGETGTMKPAEFPEKIGAIEVGGGSSADVRYVTFMNGNVELYKKPVAVGDDCVDVLSKGLISKPTKESTVAEVFAYSGWALTDGGKADSSALLAVEEDRTVYAAYTASAREYTITYYDDDGTTVLHTEMLVYGTTPNYEPEKDGYKFDGWTPEIATVTKDANYTANWGQLLTLDDYTWAQLDAMTLEEAQANFALGDTKTFSFYYASGSKVNLKAYLVGFNADTLTNGSKAKMTFLGSIGSGTEYWGATNQSTKTYPQSNFVTRKIANYDTWQDSDFASVVKSVKKSYLNSVTDSTVETTNAKWWLPSVVELGHTHELAAQEGIIYPLFEENETNFSNVHSIVGTYGKYATRSRAIGQPYQFLILEKKEVKAVATNAQSIYMLIGFCI